MVKPHICQKHTQKYLGIVVCPCDPTMGGMLRWEDDLRLGSGGCSELRLCNCTPGCVTQPDPVSEKREKRKCFGSILSNVINCHYTANERNKEAQRNSFRVSANTIGSMNRTLGCVLRTKRPSSQIA